MKRFRTWLALYLYPGDLYGDYWKKTIMLEDERLKLESFKDEFHSTSIHMSQELTLKQNECARVSEASHKDKVKYRQLLKELRVQGKKLAAQLAAYGELEAEAAEEFLMEDES